MPMIALAVLIGLLAAAQAVVTQTMDLTDLPLESFTLAVGRDAAPDRWVVRRESDESILAHLGTPGPTDGFAVAVYAGQPYRNADMSVRMKAADGNRTGGLVWRYQDPLNHYAVQLDLDEQEIAIYRLVRGNRIRMERQDDLALDPDAWHTLRVVQEDDIMRVYLGGIRVFRERDRTFRNAGGVGLWASNQASVLFDDFEVHIESERSR